MKSLISSDRRYWEYGAANYLENSFFIGIGRHMDPFHKLSIGAPVFLADSYTLPADVHGEILPTYTSCSIV